MPPAADCFHAPIFWAFLALAMRRCTNPTHTLRAPFFFYTENSKTLQREGVRAGRRRLHKWKPCQPRLTLDSTWWWHSGFVDMDVLLPSAVAVGWRTISSGWDSVQRIRLEKLEGDIFGQIDLLTMFIVPVLQESSRQCRVEVMVS